MTTVTCPDYHRWFGDVVLQPHPEGILLVDYEARNKYFRYVSLWERLYGFDPSFHVKQSFLTLVRINATT